MPLPALLLLAGEAAIAVFKHDGFVRPHPGGTLAVVLVHASRAASIAFAPAQVTLQ